MKKSLLAIAAIGAFASAAQAQSSVTVYGILDVGYIGENTRASTSANRTAAPTTANASLKSTGNQFGQSAEQSSRLGFKGTEDLGGGTSALFTVEVDLAPSTGTAVLGGTRQAFVGLQKKGLGIGAVGTQYTGIHNAVAATDPGQNNNMMGNVIYPRASGSAAAPTADSATSGTTVSYTVRTANTLTLQSDKFAGFSAGAMLVANNRNDTQTTTTVGNTTTTTGGLTNQNGWGLNANYTLQKFYVTAAYQAFTSKNDNGPTVVTTTAANGATVTAPTPAIWSSATGGSNIRDNQFYAGATYDFGILKAYAQYVARKASVQQNSGNYIKRNAEQIGVRSYITPTIEGWASIGMGKGNEFGVGAPTVNFNGWQLGSNYYLSKRTNLYAIYGQTQTSNGTVGNGAAAVSTSYGGSNYAVGVRHTF